MRPHRLIMKAFGPFADKTEVNFDAMGNHVYLIAGDTGAGKTTIFDAIVYALYGSASGSGRSKLSTDSFHSDYAKHGNVREEMMVSLTFSEGGRTFTVTRRMCWGKKGDSSKMTRKAELVENGELIAVSEAAEKKTGNDVTDKIIKIVGMDAEQFSKIIMLAQGEFKRFLEAGSSERGEILGKIYGNSREEDLQSRLDAARKRVAEKISDTDRRTEAQLHLLVIPEDTPDEEKTGIQTCHPGLPATISGIVDRQRKECAAAEQEVAELSALEKAHSTAFTKSQENNRLLDRLDQTRKNLAEEEKKQDGMDRLRGKTSLAEAAAKVLPYEEVKATAEANWRSAAGKTEALKAEQKTLQKELEEFENLRKAAEENCRAETDRLQTRNQDLNAMLSFYDDLETSRTRTAELQNTLRQATEKEKSSEAKLQELEETEKRLKERLAELEAAGDAEVQNAERRKNDLEVRLAQLEKLKKAISDIRLLGEDVIRLENQARAAQKKALDAESEHLRLSQEQFAGRAGSLARSLIQELENKGAAPCPVCGVVHRREDIPHFAATTENVPTEEQVRNAYDAWSEAREASEQANLEYQEKKQKYAQEIIQAADSGKSLVGSADWSELEDGRRVSEATASAGEELNEARESYIGACSRRNEKIRVNQELSELEPKIPEARQEAQRHRETVIGTRQELETLTASVTALEEKLKGYPLSRKDAETEISRNNQDMEALKRKTEDAARKRNEAAERVAGNVAAAKQAYEAQEKRRQDFEKAVEDYGAALARQGFAAEDAYRLALCPEGKALKAEALEHWISRGRETLRAYEDRLNELKSRISELEESTAGLERADLVLLEEQLKELQRELKLARDAENKAKNDLQTNEKVYEEVCRIEAEKTRYQKVQAKLQPVAAAANAKYSFSRYVLESFFERIIEQANLHLDTMTDGEYQLVPTGEEGDGRKLRGLGLRVLNTITNLERETASLSGGQSFEASLALALGLSDIVQMESGSSIRIDSMFIDEGFGSLDGTRLDRAMEVLEHLSAGNRQIGIISHVAKLEECLQKKIRVTAGPHGSRVSVETDE